MRRLVSVALTLHGAVAVLLMSGVEVQPIGVGTDTWEDAPDGAIKLFTGSLEEAALTRVVPPQRATTRFPSHTGAKPALWVHVSKAGGTTACSMAYKFNEAVVENKKYLCYWQGVDFSPKSVWQADTREVSCEERAEFFSSNRYTWGIIERPIEARDLCWGSFLYGVMLRDPLELALSRARFDHFNQTQVGWHLDCVETKNMTQHCSGREHTNRAPTAADVFPLWKYFDNFHIRTLGGRRTMDLPPGWVSKENAAEVIDILSNFKVVAIMETLTSGKSRAMDALREHFGWDAPDVKWAHSRRSSNNQLNFTSDQSERLRPFLQPDYIVYNHFRALDQQA